MKIGEKEFTVKITNRSIINIEEVFDKPISDVMTDLPNKNTTGKCLFISTAMGNPEVNEDYIIDNSTPIEIVNLSEYIGLEILKAFGIDLKKK